MCLPLKLTAILQLIIGLLNLHCTASYSNSREADRQRLETRQPTLQMSSGAVLSAKIIINAGDRMYATEKMPPTCIKE